MLKGPVIIPFQAASEGGHYVAVQTLLQHKVHLRFRI